MSTVSQELLIFEVGGHNFSLPLNAVEEVVPANVITGIPNSPPFLLGLSAVRGKVVGVIDCARRYGLKGGDRSYFLVCYVRGNITAITVDRPVIAGAVSIRELPAEEREALRAKSKVDQKFVRGGFELLERIDDNGNTRPTGTLCLSIDPDLFVSAEMASRVGEAA